MTTHLVIFSDESMSRARQLCYLSAITKGGIDQPHVYSSWDVRELEGAYPSLFGSHGRGYGYWSWKPYLINRLIGPDGFVRNVNDGDVICYADAGIEFIAPVQHIIDRMDQDVWLFGNNWEHAHWCKADVVEAIYPGWRQGENGEIPWCLFNKQAQASVIFFRVSDYARRFVAEWLKWCLHDGGRLIDDSPSRTPNHPEFREHRHDQAILTTLAYREGIKLHAWPAVYNRFLGQEFVYSRKGYPSSDDYPSLYHHHRLRDSEFEALRIKG